MPRFEPYPFALFEGKIVPIEEAKVSIMTNALHYGTGAFGGLKAFEVGDKYGIFRLDDHLARMKNSVGLLRFYYDFDIEKIKNSIIKLAEKNQINDKTYIRPLIYRNDLNLSPDTKGDYDLAVYMLHMPGYFDHSVGLKARISPYVRNSDKSIPSKSKATGGYINSAMAVDEAHEKGFDTAIMLTKDGYVSESAVMNLFIVKAGEVITPDLDSDILEGITRKTILELASELGIKVTQRKIEKDELFHADELFFSGSATDITWCKQVDDHKISDERGEVATKIFIAFQNLSQSHPEMFTIIK